MTLREFLGSLEQTPRTWFLRNGTSIRRRTNHLDQCPVSSIVGYGCGSYKSAAEEIGLPGTLADRIALASDCPNTLTTAGKQLRRRLLEACGISVDL